MNKRIIGIPTNFLRKHSPMTVRAERIRESFVALMSQTTRQWRRVLDQELQPLGLTQATWMALLHISRAPGPPRQKDLAASLALDTSSLVRVLDALQVAGYIDRAEHSDRRAKTIHLTPLGEEVVAQVEQVASATRQRLLAGIPQSQLETAHGVVSRIAQALDQALAGASADEGRA
jgi:MarR family transcriptional regulator for hemolysin